jgi:hypothetical protein
MIKNMDKNSNYFLRKGNEKGIIVVFLLLLLVIWYVTIELFCNVTLLFDYNYMLVYKKIVEK